MAPTFRQPFDLILDQALKVRAAEDIPHAPAGIATKREIWRESLDTFRTIWLAAPPGGGPAGNAYSY